MLKFYIYSSGAAVHVDPTMVASVQETIRQGDHGDGPVAVLGMVNGHTFVVKDSERDTAARIVAAKKEQR